MSSFDNATHFIWQNARLLERAIFEYHFFDGPAQRVLDVLRAYQNADGGFGHALEPDMRAPDSQPLFTEFALHTLYDCRLRDVQMASRACDFLARHADLQHGIATRFASSEQYPRASHWHYPGSLQPSFARLTSLVGLANWQGIEHPWLAQAVEVCLNDIATAKYDDAHTLQNAFCLLEGLPWDERTQALYKKLSGELPSAEYLCLETPVTTYGLTPLDFAPRPDAFCRRLFSTAQIEAHLDELQSKQQADGGWPILWSPPGEMAKCEWRAQRTIRALVTLRAYGRLTMDD